jgi:hypothetical protein
MQETKGNVNGREAMDIAEPDNGKWGMGKEDNAAKMDSNQQQGGNGQQTVENMYGEEKWFSAENGGGQPQRPR